MKLDRPYNVAPRRVAAPAPDRTRYVCTGTSDTASVLALAWFGIVILAAVGGAL